MPRQHKALLFGEQTNAFTWLASWATDSSVTEIKNGTLGVAASVEKVPPFLKMILDWFPDDASGSLIYSSEDQNSGKTWVPLLAPLKHW